MDREIHAIDKHHEENIKEHTYYKKIQQNLQQKQQEQSRQKDTIEKQQSQERLQVQIADQKAKEDNAPKQANVTQTMDIKDRVEVKSLSWKETQLNTRTDKEGMASHSPIQMDLAPEATEILGIKIDWQSRLNELKEAFSINIVQSRSHNFFLAKFAQIKVSIFGYILSFLGVSTDELQTLQKKAIGAAVEKNIELMGENIYNMELTELIQGQSRKVKRAIRLFKEVQSQLTVQMTKLGKADYWNKVRLCEERIKQCKKIEEEFVKEKANLRYQYEFYKQINEG